MEEAKGKSLVLFFRDLNMAAQKLRDLSQPIDVSVLDSTIEAFYGTGSKDEGIIAADLILRDLINNPEMWRQVVHILSNTQSLNTKLFALQVLEGVIKYRWDALPVEQRDGIKNYIFESDLLEILLKLFPVPVYRNLTMQCLTWVASLTLGDSYNTQYANMYKTFAVQLQTILPLSTNFRERYTNGNTEEKAFIQNLALFLTSFYKAHVRVLLDTSLLRLGIDYLRNIPFADETEVSTVILDYLHAVLETQQNLEDPAATQGIEIRIDPVAALTLPTPSTPSTPSTLSTLSVLDEAELGRCFIYGLDDVALSTFTAIAGMAVGGAKVGLMAATLGAGLFAGACNLGVKIFNLRGQPIGTGGDQYVRVLGDRRRFKLHLILTILTYIFAGASPFLLYYLISLHSKQDWVVVILTAIGVFVVHTIIWAAKERRWWPVLRSLGVYILAALFSYLGSALFTGAL